MRRGRREGQAMILITNGDEAGLWETKQTEEMCVEIRREIDLSRDILVSFALLAVPVCPLVISGCSKAQTTTAANVQGISKSL